MSEIDLSKLAHIKAKYLYCSTPVKVGGKICSHLGGCHIDINLTDNLSAFANVRKSLHTSILQYNFDV